MAARGKAGGAVSRVRAPTGAGSDGRCTVSIVFTIGASETATQPARFRVGVHGSRVSEERVRTVQDFTNVVPTYGRHRCQ